MAMPSSPSRASAVPSRTPYSVPSCIDTVIGNGQDHFKSRALPSLSGQSKALPSEAFTTSDCAVSSKASASAAGSAVMLGLREESRRIDRLPQLRKQSHADSPLHSSRQVVIIGHCHCLLVFLTFVALHFLRFEALYLQFKRSWHFIVVLPCIRSYLHGITTY